MRFECQPERLPRSAPRTVEPRRDPELLPKVQLTAQAMLRYEPRWHEKNEVVKEIDGECTIRESPPYMMDELQLHKDNLL
eukprot:gene29876-15825_t